MAKTPSSRARAPKKAPATGEKPDPFDGYDILVINSLIEDPLFGEVTEKAVGGKQADKLVVTVVTYGGQANVAYRISRLLQSMYDDIAVYVPSLCKSAGTLIATSGNQLVMTPFGEIGPLDVQLLERDELGERKSGLTMRSALEDLKGHSFDLFQHFMMEIKAKSGGTVSFRLAAELASSITSGLMHNVYDQIHPDVIGKDFRDLSVATKYCERLNKRFQNIKPRGINRLVHEYPSHDFVIDYEEAKEIFHRVTRPSARLIELAQDKGNLLMVPNVKKSVVEMIPWAAPTSATGGQDGANDGNAGATEDGVGAQTANA